MNWTLLFLKRLRALVLGSTLVACAGLGSAEVGVGDNLIVLGQSAPFSGTLSALAQQYHDGAQLYFDAINAQGGVAGRKIKVVTLDDGYDTQRALENTRKLLYDEKVFALINYFGTGISAAHLPIIAAEKVPYFAPYTGAEVLRTNFNRYLFNIRASYNDEAEKIVEHLHALGFAKIAVMHQNDPFGRAVLASVEKAMSARNLRPAAVGVIETNSTDARAAVDAIAKSDPQAVIIGAAGTGVVSFLKECRQRDFRPQFYATSVVSSAQLVKELGPDSRGIAISQVMPFPWRTTTPLVREYQRLLKARDANAAPGYTQFEGFVSAKILVDALRRTGRDLTREKLVATLERMDQTDFGGYTVGFAPAHHNGSRFVELTMIGRDGQFVR